MRTFESSAAVNSTLLSSGAAFVSSPKTRGTLDILWPCVSILILCTWSVLHLNVPIESTPKTTSQAYGRRIFLFWIKFKWMLVNLAAPEWAVGQALSNNRSVSLLDDQFEKYQSEDDVPWSRSHIYYANMGGFSILFDQSLNRPRLPVPNAEFHGSLAFSAEDTDDFPLDIWSIMDSIRRIPMSFIQHEFPMPSEIQSSARRISKLIGVINWKLDQYNIEATRAAWDMYALSYDVDKEGGPLFTSTDDFLLNVHYLAGNLWVLNASQLLVARERGIIETLPTLSQASLDDHNKGNIFVTGLALIQILWMVIQLIVRWRQSLPSSQLEILALSFATCSIITYGLLWNKPKDVQTSCTVQAIKRPSPEDLIYIACAGPATSVYIRTSIWLPNTSISRDSRGGNRSAVMFLGSALAMVVFSAFHCIAWNFKFPTEVEKLCWHISTVISACAVPLIWAIERVGYELWGMSLLSDTKIPFSPTAVRFSFRGISILIGLVFLLARIFITVEAFRSLAYLPPGAFLTTWSAGFPHFS